MYEGFFCQRESAYSLRNSISEDKELSTLGKTPKFGEISKIQQKICKNFKTYEEKFTKIQNILDNLHIFP